MGLVEQWPLFGLRVRTPRLELRSPDDELACRAGELAAEGIHDPATMPFGIPWTDAPVEDLPHNLLQYVWLNRAELSPARWHLSLVALVDGEVVGAGGLDAEHFAERSPTSPTARTSCCGATSPTGCCGSG
jgi:hypothetical protein